MLRLIAIPKPRKTFLRFATMHLSTANPVSQVTVVEKRSNKAYVAFHPI